MAKAARILLAKSRGKPGLKGWELRKMLGVNYIEVLKILDTKLREIGLRIKVVDEEGREVPLDSEKSRKGTFLIVLKEPLAITEYKTVGWRIDELGVLSATIMYIIGRRGGAPRKEIVDILKEKLPSWKVSSILDKFIRLGYLEESDNILKIGWRTRVEVDIDKLVGLKKE